MLRLLASAILVGCGALWTASAQARVWPTVVSRVELALASSELEVRREAARQLSSLPPSRIKLLLPTALADADPEVRIAAGRAALTVGYDAVAEAEAWLSDSDPAVRKMAALMLGQANGLSVGAVTALARTLSDPVAAVRLQAAKALANAPSEDGTRVLLNQIDDAQEGFVLAVIESLASLGSPSAIVPLIGKVQDPRVAVRRGVVHALGEFQGMARTSIPLGLALADSDPEVRRLAVESIARVPVLDSLPALEERVRKDRDIDVQVAALGATLELAEQVKDETQRVRALRLAVECLGNERQELRSEALAGLSKHAVSGRQVLRECVVASAGETSGPCALALAHDPEPQNASLFVDAWRQGRLGASELLLALSLHQGDQALLMVLELLGATEEAVRAQAIGVAGQLLERRGGDGRAVEPVREALARAKSPLEVADLLELLGRTRSKRAVAPILPYLEPQAPARLRAAAVRALGHVPGAAIPPASLTELLTQGDHDLRSVVYLSLREGEWTGSTPVLFQLLRAAKYDERESLGVALWGPAKHIQTAGEMSALESLVTDADERLRAALLEALARTPWSVSGAVWGRQVRVRACAHLAKVAEVLGAYPEATALLVSLLENPCVAVQANAVWALGYHGDSAHLSAVQTLAAHPDRAVSGNALAALGRIAARTRDPKGAAPFLCKQLQQVGTGGHASRAAGALYALRVTGARCGDGNEERLLLVAAPAPEVRLQAARLILALPSTSPDADARALRHCVRYDADGAVGAACVERVQVHAPAPEQGKAYAATVMVVPALRLKPEPGQPYTLETEDGAYRFGWADARGGAWVSTTTSGELKLAQPVGTW